MATARQRVTVASLRVRYRWIADCKARRSQYVRLAPNGICMLLTASTTSGSISIVRPMVMS